MIATRRVNLHHRLKHYYVVAFVIQESGLSKTLGDNLKVFANYDPWVMNLIFSLIVAAATEVTSNTAMATLLMPILVQVVSWSWCLLGLFQANLYPTLGRLRDIASCLNLYLSFKHNIKLFFKHNIGLSFKHNIKLFFKHNIELSFKHNIKLFFKHNIELSFKHNIELYFKHNIELSFKHNIELYFKHNIELSFKHNIELYFKHNIELYFKHNIELSFKHNIEQLNQHEFNILQ